MTCVLLPSEGQGGQIDDNFVVLPRGADLEQALGSGACYSKPVSRGLKLHWKQSQLSLHQNILASRLAGTAVCGDAVVELSNENDCSKETIITYALQNAYHSPIDRANFPPWASLPSELLSNIISVAGNQPSLALAMSQVCSSWRRSLEAETVMQRKLEFNGIRTIGNVSNTVSLPWVLRQSASAGNLRASVLVARLLTGRNRETEAKKHWIRAARMGHPEACWRVGVAYYHGTLDNCPQDTEEALVWLSRAVKALLPTTEDFISFETNPSLLMSNITSRMALRECAHILGVVHLDGDATKQDTTTAIKWLQIAERCGCSEATKMLQSLFRSGQY